jgi:hypothetical protein
VPVPNASRITWDTSARRRGKHFVRNAGTQNRKLFARLHEDGENVVVRIGKKDCAALIRANAAFHVTGHYAGFTYVLVRLRDVSWEDLGICFTAFTRWVDQWRAREKLF